MALVKKGNRYYMVFREGKKTVWRATGCTNRRDAQFVERQVAERRKVARACAIAGVEAPACTDTGAKRYRLDAMPAIASKHRAVSREANIYWSRFIEQSGLAFADEATPQACQEYLDREYGGKSAKTYNNVKTYLNNMFRACFGETGIASPFAQLLARRGADVEHHRAYTEAEVARILDACTPAWRFLVMVAVNTGMSKESAMRFCPDWLEVRDGVTWARYTRSKTARFGRACLVPLRQCLLDILPPVDAGKPYITAFGGLSVHESENGFRVILEKAGIGDTADGRADFHSLRATFITRCRERGIAEHAIRSMVGHVEASTTDLYSHDTVSPLGILRD